MKYHGKKRGGRIKNWKQKKSSSKQVVAILLLVIGLIAGVFGILGLVGGGGTDPYEARNGVVMIGVIAQDSQGNTASGMGTGFAIGNPGTCRVYCDKRPCGAKGLRISQN